MQRSMHCSLRASSVFSCTGKKKSRRLGYRVYLMVIVIRFFFSRYYNIYLSFQFIFTDLEWYKYCTLKYKIMFNAVSLYFSVVNYYGSIVAGRNRDEQTTTTGQTKQPNEDKGGWIYSNAHFDIRRFWMASYNTYFFYQIFGNAFFSIVYDLRVWSICITIWRYVIYYNISRAYVYVYKWGLKIVRLSFANDKSLLFWFFFPRWYR